MTPRHEWPRDPRTQRYLPHSGYPTTLQPWMRANRRPKVAAGDAGEARARRGIAWYAVYVSAAPWPATRIRVDRAP